VFKVRALNLPDDLMLRRRCVEHEVRTRRVERITQVCKGGSGVFVEIEVDVADFANALLRGL